MSASKNSDTGAAARNAETADTDRSLMPIMNARKTLKHSALTLTAAVVGADTKSIGGAKAYASPVNGKDTAKAGLVLGAKFAF